MAKKDINNTNDDEKIAAALAAIEEVDAEVEAEEKAKAEEEAKVAEERRKEALKQIEREKLVKKIKEDMPNEGRRFFLMVEDTEVLEDAIVVLGNIHGEIKVNDRVYINRPSVGTIASTVTAIESDETGETSSAAKNARIKITLPIKFKNVGYEPDQVAPMFSVISGVPPMATETNKTFIENPALLGLTLEYGKYSTYPEFNKALMTKVLQAKFILPAHEGETMANGKKSLRLITMTIQKKDSSKPEITMPIFTDAITARQWKEVFEDGDKKTILVAMSFDEVAKKTADDGLDFVINPRGPIAVRIPRDIVSKITTDPNYQKAVEARKKQAQIAKEVIGSKEAAKTYISQPMPTNEFKEIKRAMSEYAATNSDINAFGVVIKLQGGKKSYLTIVDCSKSTAATAFNGLIRAAKPFLNGIKTMDFSLYQETVFADDYFTKVTLDYVRNPNI